MASHPAYFLHVSPGFESVVAQHPPGGLRNWVSWRDPGEGAHLHPLGVECCGIRAELGQQLLILAVEPPLTTGLLRWLVTIAVLVRHGLGWLRSGTVLQSSGRSHDFNTLMN